MSPPAGWAKIGPQTPSIKRDTDREIQLNTYFNSNDAGRPLLEIADALKKDFISPRFRVSWYISMGGSHYGGTALYDRTERSIKLYEVTSFEGEGGGISRTIFTKVNDDLLLTFATDYEPGKYEGKDVSIRSLLPKLGCNTYEIR